MTHRTILCLDLGTTTGWALLTYTSIGPDVISGFWDFRPGRFDGAGVRYVRFRNQLQEILKTAHVDQLLFEEVRRHIGADAARVYGALFGVVTSLCEELTVPYEGVPVGTIKKAWTGKGNASKADMLKAARDRGHEDLKDDNQIDAVALAYVAWERDREHVAPLPMSVLS